MTRLSSHHPDNNRGQVLLATAFIIAGILVLLIGITSSGLFAPATVTESDVTPASTADAITYGISRDIQKVLQQSSPPIGDITDGLSPSDRTIIRERVADDVTAITAQYEQLYTTSGASVTINSNVDTAPVGVYISQSSMTSFPSGSHKTLARNTVEPTVAVLVIDTETMAADDSLSLVFTPTDGPTETYIVRTGETPTNGVIEAPDGSTCRFPINGQQVRVDLVDRDSSDCTLPWAFEDNSRQRLESIQILNGTSMEGQFGVTVQDPGTGDKLSTPVVNDESVSAKATLTELSLTVTYETPKTTYQRRITIHPTDTLS